MENHQSRANACFVLRGEIFNIGACVFDELVRADVYFGARVKMNETHERGISRKHDMEI
jgi:hypothetical protein